jgi:hypothetical protein
VQIGGLYFIYGIGKWAPFIKHDITNPNKNKITLNNYVVELRHYQTKQNLLYHNPCLHWKGGTIVFLVLQNKCKYNKSI